MMEPVRADNGGPACGACSVHITKWAASDGLIKVVLYGSDAMSQIQVTWQR